MKKMRREIRLVVPAKPVSITEDKKCSAGFETELEKGKAFFPSLKGVLTIIISYMIPDSSKNPFNKRGNYRRESLIRGNVY